MQPTTDNNLIKSYLDLKDLCVQLDSAQNPDGSEIERKIENIFGQILPFIAKFTEADISLRQLIIGLKVLDKQDRQIYHAVLPCYEIFFRIYRLEQQIDDFKNSKTVHVAKDLLKQITHNIKQLVTHHHEKPLEAYDWSYTSSLIERLDTPPLFLQRNDLKKHLEKGLLQGLHLVKQRCQILTRFYEGISTSNDEADSAALQESSKQTFSEMLLLLEQQDFSIEKLVILLAKLPLFFDQNRALYDFFDTRPEKECLSLRLERLSHQLTRYKEHPDKDSPFADDLYKQINEAVLFFAERDSINQLEEGVKQKILTLLLESRMLPTDPSNLLKPERCFLIQLENVRELALDNINKKPLHERPPFVDLLLEFQKITQKLYEKKIGHSNWVNVCNRIFRSISHNECLYAFLTTCLVIDADLGLEFIKNWMVFLQSFASFVYSSTVPYSLALLISDKKHPLLDAFVARFKALITAYKVAPDRSWDELCSFFIGYEDCAKRISILSFASYHAQEEITLFLANCYALHTTFLKSDDRSKERSQLLYPIVRVFEERPSLIEKVRPSLVGIKVEEPADLEATILLKALEKSDPSTTKIDVKIEWFYLLLNRGIHLRANGEFSPQVFAPLEKIYAELADLYADRTLTTTLPTGKIDETDRWRQICNAVIKSRALLGREYYDKLKQKAIESPRRSMYLGERLRGLLSLPENIAIIASWFKDKFHDGNRPWKRKKYQVAIEGYRGDIEKKKTQVELWLNDATNPKEFQKNTLLLLNKINTKITEESDPRVQHAIIMHSLRQMVALELFKLCVTNLHSIEYTNGCVHLLIELCKMRMRVNMYPYLKELIRDMTELGLKALECIEPLYGFYLAEKNYLLLDLEIQHLAIKTVPQEEKAPEVDLWYNRYQSLRGYHYDPHVEGGNLPFLIGSLIDKQGRSITNTRCGSPTTQKNKVAVINPEFEVLVNECRVLYINLQKPFSGAFDTQGERSDALGSLGRKYPNNAFIVGMCPNTDWMHQKGSYEDKGEPLFKSFSEYEAAIMASLYDINSGYYFPKNLRIDPIFKGELKTNVNCVRDIFFHNEEVFDTLKRRMFNLALNLKLIDFLLDKVKAEVLIAACNHGADRAGVYNGSFMKMLYILTGKRGEEYDEYLSVLIQSASMIVNKDAMNHNFDTLMDFMKLLDDPGVQARLKANKDKFNIRDIKLPFEKKEDLTEEIPSEPASAAAKPLFLA